MNIANKSTSEKNNNQYPENKISNSNISKNKPENNRHTHRFICAMEQKKRNQKLTIQNYRRPYINRPTNCRLQCTSSQLGGWNTIHHRAPSIANRKGYLYNFLQITVRRQSYPGSTKLVPNHKTIYEQSKTKQNNRKLTNQYSNTL